MKWKRFFASTAIAVMAFTASGVVSTVPSAFADTQTQAPAQNSGTGIPGMPNPSFTGETPNAGFSTGTETDVGTYIGKKFKLGLTILFGIATIVIICFGVWKGMRLSGSNSKNRSDAQHDLFWWVVGGAVTFAAAVICGLLYAFSTTA